MRQTVEIIISSVETKNVYLDTTVFDGVRLHFNAEVLQKLENLVHQGEIKIFITKITKQEVKSHIEKEVRRAATQLKKFRSEAHILEDAAAGLFKPLFAKPDIAGLISEIDDEFDSLLRSLNAEEIPFDNFAVSPIFENYFQGLPPFSERKKSEFPDAFVTAACERWCEAQKAKMYVISNDKDIVAVCASSARLLPLRKIDELLNLFAFEERDIANFAASCFRAIEDDIKGAISEDFTELGFVLEDLDGDVENPVVSEVELVNEYILEVDEHGARFSVEAKIKFQVDVSFGDPDSMYRDSDTRDFVYLDTINETITRTESFSVIVEIGYEIINEPDQAELRYIGFSEKDIRIFYDTEVYPYK